MKTTFNDLPEEIEKINQKLDKIYQLLLLNDDFKI